MHNNLIFVFQCILLLCDCLAAKKPVIEFWLNNIDNIDFIKDKKNDWISIYTKLDLVEPVNNYNLLEKKIKKILKEPIFTN